MDRHVLQGGGGAVQESCYGSGGHQAEVVVEAFLMELLEDTPAAAAPEQQQSDDDDTDDRLSRVMRSLEAEIGGVGAGPAPLGSYGDGGSAGAPASGCGEDGRLELDDVLSVSDFYGSSSQGSWSADSAPPPPPPPALALQSFEYWARAELPPAMGHDMGGGWCVNGVDGLAAVAGYEFREPCYYTYGYGYNESSHVEQPYSPLWE